MAWHDDVAALRQENSDKQQAQNDHVELLETIRGNPLPRVDSKVIPTDDKGTQDRLVQLHSLVHEFLALVANRADLGDKVQQDVLQALKSLELSPTVNVPKGAINVQVPAVDLKPLQDTLRELLAPKETDNDDNASEDIDLSCFKAQDLRESDNMQYVGFLHPNGSWYIIENDTQQNQLRYVFGTKDYAKAFKKAASYQYHLLDEAINALSA